MLSDKIEVAKEDDVQCRIQMFREGADFWRNYEDKKQLSCKDYVVVLASENADINYYTLKYLSALKNEKNANRIFLLSSSEAKRELAMKYATCEYQMDIVAQSDIANLCILFSVYKFSEQIIINTYNNTADTDAMELIGTAGITIQDIVAISMFGLSKVPDDGGVTSHVLEKRKISFKAINWNAPENAIFRTKEEFFELEVLMKRAFSYVMNQGKITKDNKIVLFGATTASMYLMDFLKDYNVVAIVDNNERKVGKIIRGVKVYFPEDYLSEYDSDYRILVSSQYYRPMCEQLNAMGYVLNEQVFVSYFTGPRWNVLPETIDLYADWAIEGYNSYKDITQLCPQKTLLLCPYTGSGDIYLIGLYINQFIKSRNIEDYVLVVISNSCKKVASLFGMNTCVISEAEMRRLHKFARIMGYVNEKIYIMNDCFDQVVIGRLRGYKELDFHTMFQKVLFHQEEKAKNVVPFQKNSDEFFINNDLKPGKTIMISPYANTTAKIEEKIWGDLVKALQDKGYDVVTNVAGDKEKPIPGTIGLFVPYIQIIDFLNKAGGFIALRSGLCDIVSSTKAKMCVLYPEGSLFMNASTYDYFSLERMKLRDEDFLEIEFSENNQLECYEKMIHYF